MTITLHAADGRVLGDSLFYTVPRNAKLRGDLNDLFARNPAARNAQGWLEVSSSSDRLVGTVSFNNSDDTFLTSFELSGTPLKQFVFPLTTEDSQYQTAIAILNANDVSATVTARALESRRLDRSHCGSDSTAPLTNSSVPERSVSGHATATCRKRPDPIGPAGARLQPDKRPGAPFPRCSTGDRLSALRTGRGPVRRSLAGGLRREIGLAPGAHLKPDLKEIGL